MLGVKVKENDIATALEFEVFYDGQQALTLFFYVQTQWRVGFGGATGLDYVAVLAVINLWKIKPKKQLLLLDEIKALEQGALKAWSEKAKAAEERAKNGNR